MKKLLIISDVHVPFHDVAKVETVCKVLRAFKPDVFVINGDFLDCANVSFFDKDPGRAETFEDEIKAGRRLLKRLVDCTPGSTRIFVAGNHEDRLPRYVMRRAPDLFPFVSIPKLLGLNKLGFQWVPYREGYHFGKLYITHDVGGAGAMAGVKARDIYGGNVAIGHTHFLSANYRGNLKGRQFVGLNSGWLGDLGRIDYLHKARASMWSHGFLVGYQDVRGNVHCNPVPFIENTCVVEGKLFK